MTRYGGASRTSVARTISRLQDALPEPVQRYGHYVVLPLLGVAAAAAPEHLAARWAFAIIVVATYVIVRGSQNLFGIAVLAATLAALRITWTSSSAASCSISRSTASSGSG